MTGLIGIGALRRMLRSLVLRICRLALGRQARHMRGAQHHAGRRLSAIWTGLRIEVFTHRPHGGENAMTVAQIFVDGHTASLLMRAPASGRAAPAPEDRSLAIGRERHL